MGPVANWMGGSSITATGSLSNLPTVGKFEFYWTDPSANFQRGNDATVSSGVFSLTAPPSSRFTLTNTALDTTPPSLPKTLRVR